MNLDNHPCFNPNACSTHGRIHLPVAPRCNIQCNFCNRKFDCVNESRPGVSSGILKPFQALAFLDKMTALHGNISVVGIAGPGDPFANPHETLTTLELVKKKYPDMLLCLASNGLNLPDYIDDIKRLDVTHVSITINTVDPDIGSRIYSWVRFNKKSLPPEKGARILLEKQLESIQRLKQNNILVKVNTIVMPGINDRHVIDVAKKMAEMDVDLFNCMPYYPNPGANFSHLGEPTQKQINDLQKRAGEHIPQMRHCRRCRADAVGLLGASALKEEIETLQACTTLKEFNTMPESRQSGNLVAVASKEGVLVNQHLGEAARVEIWDVSLTPPRLIGHRTLPAPGSGDLRWQTVAERLRDCSRILVSGAGERPRKILAASGIELLMVEGLIADILAAIQTRQNLDQLTVRTPFKCDHSCEGAGMGCM